MDDDGLILNFAPAEEGVVANTPKNTKVTGGSWKERRNLKLKLQGRERKPGSGVNSIRVKNEKFDKLKAEADRMMAEHEGGNKKKSFDRRRDNDRKPAKKFDADKEPDSKKRESETPLGISGKKAKFAESSGARGGNNNSYVSSLFTSNKASETLKETTGSQTAYTPSNAPLRDSSTFAGLGLNEKLVTHLTGSMRYLAPTKVQRAVAPEMLTSATDLFVKAQTGSGKTLAFVLPIVEKLMAEAEQINRQSGLFALILTPTRELASQIYSVLESLLRCHHHIVPGIVVGGEKKKSEKARIRKGVNIMVATPGRLADHLENTSSFDISQVRWLVLDEGDRLVELGFQETITKITDQLSRSSKVMDTMHKWPGLPTRRVNVLCSATMPEDVKKLGNTVLNNPKMISLDRESTDTSNATAPDQLIQKVMVVPPKLRLVTLSAVLKNVTKQRGEAVSRTIVFFSCSDSVNFHFEVFARGGKALRRKQKETQVTEKNEKDEKDDKAKEDTPESCVSTAPEISKDAIVYRLHGSLSQQLRTSTLQQFVQNEGENEGKHLVLFCTDVASRGLDLPDISHVVEYDPPFALDDHLHRIGRTARAGKKGEATLFLLPGEEEGYVEGKLRTVHPKQGSLRIVGYEKGLEAAFADESAEPASKTDPKAKNGKWDIQATTWHLEVERWLLEDSAALERALHAFVSHIRAYATHLAAERMYFNVKLLHLGHLAKSFGLRETPKKLGRQSGQVNELTHKKKEDPRKKMLRMARLAEKSNTSEFNY
ncbi:CIC11C00000000019 [Sungouiella intermedia]|uniref:ATP-dependent RNA helicase n=1 Tax=Sungouiella intermedia TaxID=45354 RepID=A0A1L0C0G7_9ASCO|nr:CIC11C00000000019 [[Candida] intermedia]